MSMEIISQFEHHWKSFLVRLNGKILKLSSQELTLSRMNLILRDCALDWSSEETVCGRWLIELSAAAPAKAASIRSILLEDMCFTPIDTAGDHSGLLQAAAPVVGLAAGVFLSRYWNAALWQQAVSAVASATIFGAGAKVYGDKRKTSLKAAAQAAYMEQLEKYRSSILSTLQS